MYIPKAQGNEVKKRIIGETVVKNNTKESEKDYIIESFSLFKVFCASFCQHWKHQILRREMML